MKGKAIDSFGSKHFKGKNKEKEVAKERDKKRKKDKEEKSQCLAEKEGVDLHGGKSRQGLAITFKQGEDSQNWPCCSVWALAMEKRWWSYLL